MEEEVSLGGNCAIVATEAQGEDIFNLDFLPTLLLYNQVLPERAIHRGPLFRRNGLLYRQSLNRHSSVTISSLQVKALRASGPSCALGAHTPPDSSKGWQYVGVMLCVEPHSCPNRLVPFPGGSWLLACPPSTASMGHGQQDSQQRQEVVGVDAGVAAEAAAAAMVAGWRPLPYDLRRGVVKGPFAHDNDGRDTSLPDRNETAGRGGGACSLPLLLSADDCQEANQLRLLILYSDKISDRASRLSMPSTRRLPSTMDVDSDLLFNTFPTETPIWAAVLTPAVSEAEATAAMGATAAKAVPIQRSDRSGSEPPVGASVQWPTTLGSVQVLSCAGFPQCTMGLQHGGSGVECAAGMRTETTAAVMPQLRSVVRIHMEECVIGRKPVTEIFNPNNISIHDAPTVEYLTIALDSVWSGQAGCSNGAGASTSNGSPCMSVDLEVGGWTLRNLQTPHHSTGVPPDGDVVARSDVSTLAAASVVAAVENGGDGGSEAATTALPSLGRRRMGLTQRRWWQRRQELDFDEQAFGGPMRRIVWIWHSLPSAGDLECSSAEDPCRAHNLNSALSPNENTGARVNNGSGPSGACALPSPAPHAPGPRGASSGVRNGVGVAGRDCQVLQWGCALHVEESERLRCAICKLLDTYDSLACLMAHIWSCHSQLIAALECGESNMAGVANAEDRLVCIHLMRSPDAVDWRALLAAAACGEGHFDAANEQRRLLLPKPVEEDWVTWNGRIFNVIDEPEVRLPPSPQQDNQCGPQAGPKEGQVGGAHFNTRGSWRGGEFVASAGEAGTVPGSNAAPAARGDASHGFREDVVAFVGGPPDEDYGAKETVVMAAAGVASAMARDAKRWELADGREHLCHRLRRQSSNGLDGAEAIGDGSADGGRGAVATVDPMHPDQPRGVGFVQAHGLAKLSHARMTRLELPEAGPLDQLSPDAVSADGGSLTYRAKQRKSLRPPRLRLVSDIERQGLEQEEAEGAWLEAEDGDDIVGGSGVGGSIRGANMPAEGSRRDQIDGHFDHVDPICTAADAAVVSDGYGLCGAAVQMNCVDDAKALQRQAPPLTLPPRGSDEAAAKRGEGGPGVVTGNGGSAMRKRPASVAEGDAARIQRRGAARVWDDIGTRRVLVKPSNQLPLRPGLCQDFSKARVFVHSRSLMPLSKEEVERRFPAAAAPAAAAMAKAVEAAAAENETVTDEAVLSHAAKLSQPPSGAPLASDSDSDTDDEEWARTQRAHLAGLAAPHSVDSGLPTTARLSPSEQHMMFLWNRFARHNPVHSDRIVAERLLQFVDDLGGQEIAAAHNFRELRRALVCHLSALREYSLIGPETIVRCLKRVDELRQIHSSGQQMQQQPQHQLDEQQKQQSQQLQPEQEQQCSTELHMRHEKR